MHNKPLITCPRCGEQIQELKFTTTLNEIAVSEHGNFRLLTILPQDRKLTHDTSFGCPKCWTHTEVEFTGDVLPKRTGETRDFSMAAGTLRCPLCGKDVDFTEYLHAGTRSVTTIFKSCCPCGAVTRVTRTDRPAIQETT